jgi:hypothetical protein
VRRATTQRQRRHRKDRQNDSTLHARSLSPRPRRTSPNHRAASPAAHPRGGARKGTVAPRRRPPTGRRRRFERQTPPSLLFIFFFLFLFLGPRDVRTPLPRPSTRRPSGRAVEKKRPWL